VSHFVEEMRGRAEGKKAKDEVSEGLREVI
jgi:hypothetical protein